MHKRVSLVKYHGVKGVLLKRTEPIYNMQYPAYPSTFQRMRGTSTGDWTYPAKSYKLAIKKVMCGQEFAFCRKLAHCRTFRWSTSKTVNVINMHPMSIGFLYHHVTSALSLQFVLTIELWKLEGARVKRACEYFLKEASLKRVATFPPWTKALRHLLLRH